MSKLTLNTFNEMLFSAFKEQTPEKKKELLDMELQVLSGILTEKHYDLCDELIKIGYESELFTEINNLKSNGETLLEQLAEVEKQIAEVESRTGGEDQNDD